MRKRPAICTWKAERKQHNFLSKEQLESFSRCTTGRNQIQKPESSAIASTTQREHKHSHSDSQNCAASSSARTANMTLAVMHKMHKTTDQRKECKIRKSKVGGPPDSLLSFRAREIRRQMHRLQRVHLLACQIHATSTWAVGAAPHSQRARWKRTSATARAESFAEDDASVNRR